MEGNHRVYGVMCMGINKGIMGKTKSVNTVISVDSVNISNCSKFDTLFRRFLGYILNYKKHHSMNNQVSDIPLD